MILWGRASSVNVQKVLWALDEAGRMFTHQVVGGKYGGLDDPAFAALTPVRRVPVLQDGDTAIWESHAILRHLARVSDRLAAPLPATDVWLDFGTGTLQPPFIGYFWQVVRFAPQDRDADAAAGHLYTLRDALTMLERGLVDARPYLSGDAFSIADIALGSLFYRLTDLLPDILDPLPLTAAWHGRIARREGYRARVATSYDELKVT